MNHMICTILVSAIAAGAALAQPTTQPTSQPATMQVTLPDGNTITVGIPDGVDPGMISQGADDLRRNAAIAQDVLRQLQPASDRSAQDEPESARKATTAPTSMSATTRRGAEDQLKRRSAEKLIQSLATASPEQLETIEKQLAELGSATMVPLRLAELSDNFELRQRAMRVSSRLRWRLACSPALLREYPDLINIMSGQDSQARGTLVDKIATSAGPQTIGFFGECLTDPQSFVRQKAIDGLVTAAGTSPNPEVNKHLDAALSDSDRNVRLLAVGAMAKIKAADIDRLARLLDDDSLEVRASVIAALGLSGKSKAVEYLKPLLNDPLWRIRAATLEALDDLVQEDKSSSSVASSVVVLLGDDDAFVRGLAAKLVAKWRYKPATAQLLKLLQDGKINESVAFASLAAMGDLTARAMLLERYAAATDVDRRVELLQMMNAYANDGEVDGLLMAALKDETFKARRAEVMELTRGRKSWQQFFPMICELLESPDEGVALAAWGLVERWAYEKAVPEETIDRLLSGPDGRRGVWGLTAAYLYNDLGTFPALLKRAVVHPSPEVAGLALGMVGKEYLQDSLGATVPSYRREPSRSSYSGPGATTIPRRPAMPGYLTDTVRKAMAQPEAMVRLRAAAIVYRLGLDSSPAPAEILRTGLAESNAALQLIALAGIVEKPQPFLDKFDLLAASKAPELSARAIDVMAGTGDPKYTAHLLAMAAGENYTNQSLMKALARSGDSQAIELVHKKFSSAGTYQITSFMNQLAGMSGPGPVMLTEKFLAGKMEEYEKRELVGVLVTLPDKSALPVLKKVFEDKNLERSDTKGRVAIRLAELDPQQGAPLLRKMLVEGKAQDQDYAFQALMQAKPTPELESMVLEAGQKSGQIDSGTWVSAINWLTPEGFRGKFLPALSSLDATAQKAVLQRVGNTLSDADLEVLLKVSVTDSLLRENLSALIAMMTADQPQRRPELGTLSDGSLAAVLSAAAEWPDAPKVVQPYLNDSRPDVAGGARRGLALYLLGNPQAPVTDAWRDALIEALQSADAVTAYLSAEALALRWKETFLRIDPASLKSASVSARQAVAFGQDVPTPLREKLAGIISGRGGATAKQLALVSAGQSYDASYKVSMRGLIGQVDTDLLVRVAVASGKEDLLEPLLAYASLRRGADVKPLGAKLLAKARQNGGKLFMTLAENGWIEQPAEGDLLRLMRSASSSRLAQDNSSMYGLPLGWPVTTSSDVVDLALAWAPAKPDEEIVKLIAIDSFTGLMAATVAGVSWNMDAGHAALLKAASTPLKKNARRQNQYRSLALRGLELCARPGDGAGILKAYLEVKEDDYELQQVRVGLVGPLSHFAPREAIKALTGGANDQSSGGGQIVPAYILPVLADDKDWPGQAATMPSDDAEPDSIASPGEAPVDIYNALLQLKAPGAGQTTSAPATTRPAGSAFGEQLAAPWGGSWKQQLASQPQAVARARVQAELDGIIQKIKSRAQAGPEENKDLDGPGEFAEWWGEGDTQVGDMDDSTMDRNSLIEAARPFMGVYGKPELYYAGGACTEDWFVPVYLKADDLVAQVRPLLANEQSSVRVEAMRAAARWRLTALGDELANHLANPKSDTSETIEAAWALAILRGLPAVEPITQAYQRQGDFSTRVRLACLLRLLGSEAGRADIDRAVSLRTIRQFRLKFLNTTEPSNRYPLSIHHRPIPARASVPISERMLPWLFPLEYAANDLIEQADGLFPLPPGGPRSAMNDKAGPEAGREPLSLARLHMETGLRLAVPGVAEKTIYLPLPELAADVYEAPLFAWLPRGEQDLEPHFLVQFSAQAGTPAELLGKWQAWWQANQGQSREQWWRQAAGLAADDLTSPKWWNRMLAARRLVRLTGLEVAAPGAFDLPAWQRLQSQWRQWLADRQGVRPRAWLLTAGVEAGLLPEGAQSHAADDAAWLADLVTLAGFAAPPLSEAAMLQLQAWPDEEQLARASLPWQHSPRPALAQWTQRSLAQLTGKARLIYTEADLPAATTQPTGR